MKNFHYKMPFILGVILILLLQGISTEGKAINMLKDSTLLLPAPDTLNIDSTIIDKIPPLQSLIDSALVNSYKLHRQIKEEEIKQLETTSITQEWLRYINIFATSNYGVYDNFMSVQDQTTIGSTLNTGNSFRWSVGVTISGTPLYDFFNRPTVKKIKKLEAEQELNTRQDMELEIRKTVIQQYNQTLMSYHIMLIAQENVYSNYAMLLLSEKLFANGELELAALTNIREMYYKSLMTAEQNKYEFNMNYLILQAICGFEF